MKLQDRVQIPAYTTAWMQGARYGVVKSFKTMRGDAYATYAVIKLDKANRNVIALIDDCEVVS